MVIEPPPAYGYTIFCDDVRKEDTGKLIYIGIYQGQMVIHRDFPFRVSKFAFAVTYFERQDAGFTDDIELNIFLPGDPEDTPSVKSVLPAENARLRIENADKLELPADSNPLFRADAMFVMDGLLFKNPGHIRVRASVGGRIVKLGSLSVVAGNTPPDPTKTSN